MYASLYNQSSVLHPMKKQRQTKIIKQQKKYKNKIKQAIKKNVVALILADAWNA